MANMTDAEAIDFIVEKLSPRKTGHGGLLAASERLGVSSQAISNWRERGIPSGRRTSVWRLCNGLGAALPVEWALDPMPPAEPAAPPGAPVEHS